MDLRRIIGVVGGRAPRTVTVGRVLREARAWADGVRCTVSVDRATARLILPGPGAMAIGVVRRAVSDASSHGASRIRCAASATDGGVVVTVVDDGGQRAPVERILPAGDGTATEVGYHHAGSHVMALEYTWPSSGPRRRVNVSAPWPRVAESSAIPRPERRSVDPD